MRQYIEGIPEALFTSFRRLITQAAVNTLSDLQLDGRSCAILFVQLAFAKLDIRSLASASQSRHSEK